MVLKNLSLVIKKHTILFIVIIITQIMAVVMTLLSYGFFENNRLENNALDNSHKELYVYFPGEDYESTTKMQKAFPEVVDGYENIINRMYVEGYVSTDMELTHGVDENGNKYAHDYVFFSYSCGFEEGRYTVDDPLSKGFLSVCEEDIWFTEDEVNSGEKLCVVNLEVLNNSDTEVLELGGEMYKIINNEKVFYAEEIQQYSFGNCIIPLESLPKKTDISYFTIDFTRNLLKSEYDELIMRIQEALDTNIEVEEYVVVDLETRASLKSQMIMSSFMAVMSAFVICIVYRYLQLKREKTTAIYQIVGCTRLRAALLYICEVIIILMLPVIPGYFIFLYIEDIFLRNYFEWFGVIYRDEIELKLIGLYLAMVVIVIAVMLIFSTRKTPKEMLRGRK